MWNSRKTPPRGRSAIRSIGVSLLALLSALAIAGCGGGGSSSSASSKGGKTLDVVGYSTPESVYAEDIEPAFEKTAEGNDVSFSNSFGASGEQSRAVAAGQPASIVHFAQAGDMERLVQEGEIVAKNWESQPYKGIAEDSVVTITVRKGNPKGIKTFNDLLSKNVQIITPNPFSSGSARWNLMAVYGTVLNEGKSPAEALAAVKNVLSKTIAQPGSARDATEAFSQGEGDVLLGYENEAIKLSKEGNGEYEYIVPPSTIQIETPIAVTKSAPEPAAQDFLKFVWSNAGQEIWAENGYRPVNPKLVNAKQFPTPPHLFKISQFGGWAKVNKEFFDEETGSVAKIENELGVSTSS
ncbi:MAG TPA: sulfate ABC transporter substrate-binding protein [Solirubrobacteraceae bacterium]|jgi:sulfate transport system substrate-binding protein